LGYGPADSGPWGEADTDALLEAQAGLNEFNGEDLDVDGVWGPQTDEVIRKYIGVARHENEKPATIISPDPVKGTPPAPGQAPASDRRAPAILFGAAAASMLVYTAIRRWS